MSVRMCTFIREATGQPCQGIAVKGSDRCHHHQADFQRRQYIKELRAKGGTAHIIETFELPPLDTLDDVQICLSKLFQAVAARRVMEEDTDRLLAILRLASRNLRIKDLTDRRDSRPGKSNPKSNTKSPVPLPDISGWSHAQIIEYYVAVADAEEAAKARIAAEKSSIESNRESSSKTSPSERRV